MQPAVEVKGDGRSFSAGSRASRSRAIAPTRAIKGNARPAQQNVDLEVAAL